MRFEASVALDSHVRAEQRWVNIDLLMMIGLLAINFIRINGIQTKREQKVARPCNEVIGASKLSKDRRYLCLKL